jgi:cyanophycin synthetase
LTLACTVMNELAAGRSVRPEAVTANLQKLAKQFRPLAPGGVNTLRFLQAAHELDIPWRHVANNVYQFGWGSRSRWLDSSFTDMTSTISASLARDKVACAKVLRDAGLPVPRHALVNTAEQAVRVAQSMGYPVVLKPANLDGGTGVMAGLRDAEEVKKAFTAVAKLSRRILVEEFIQGSDYRVRTCNGVVNGVVIRKPAAVVGDGIQSVQDLIDAKNRERANITSALDPDMEQGSKPVVLDDEVRQWVVAQGLTLDSVVPLGQRLRLRGAANVSLGGTTWDVSHEAHPDNLELALRAAAALRLDVAGVDLLLPDIKKSWTETGGAVCEVNGQPQFSHSRPIKKVLQSLVNRQGRIPVVFIYGQSVDDVQVKTGVMAKLRAKGLEVGWHEGAADCVHTLCNKGADALVWAPRSFLGKLAAVPVDRPSLVVEVQPKGDDLVQRRNGMLEYWSCPGSPEGITILQKSLTEWLSSVLQSK